MDLAIIVTGPAGSGKSHWIQRYAESRNRQLFVCPCRKDRTLREGRQKLHLWGRRIEPAILWLEGADDLTPEAQAFLRRILETHAPQVQFVLECRDSNKLQDPIRSRCITHRMKAPSIEDIEASVASIRGINMDEIRKYLMPHEYSYRRIKHCVDLQLHFPDVWKEVLTHRGSEKAKVTEVKYSDIPCYIASAYHPEILLLPYLNESNIEDYGECLDNAGSLWAFLSYAAPAS